MPEDAKVAVVAYAYAHPPTRGHERRHIIDDTPFQDHHLALLPIHIGTDRESFYLTIMGVRNRGANNPFLSFLAAFFLLLFILLSLLELRLPTHTQQQTQAPKGEKKGKDFFSGACRGLPSMYRSFSFFFGRGSEETDRHQCAIYPNLPIHSCYHRESECTHIADHW